jgi:DNA-binding winged helix-turn-helix (wHTH) protein
VDVELVRWPIDDELRGHLAANGQARLLLVEGGTEAPIPVDLLEDWIRVPVTDADVAARVEGLRRRAAGVRTAEPVLDADGVLRFDGGWVSLPPVEARLTAALIDRFGAVVRRDELAVSGWPEGAPGRNALDVHVLRLRRRIGAVGLVITTVRSRGYLLEAGRTEDRAAGDEAKGTRQVHVRQA